MAGPDSGQWANYDRTKACLNEDLRLEERLRNIEIAIETLARNTPSHIGGNHQQDINTAIIDELRGAYGSHRYPNHEELLKEANFSWPKQRPLE